MRRITEDVEVKEVQNLRGLTGISKELGRFYKNTFRKPRVTLICIYDYYCDVLM